MTDGAIVRFDGGAADVAELSWGQREMWSVMQAKGSSLPFGSVRPLPPGQTVAGVAAGLRFIMGRHQSLRTTLRFGPGGHVQQAVHATGEITLDVVDAGGEDPASVAAAVAARYRAADFDHERDWPLRIGVVTHRGAATHVVKVLCHLAVDAFGLAALDDDFDRHAGLATGPAAPVTALQPAEQARWQRGPAGVRAHEASVRYVEKLAVSAQVPGLGVARTPRAPRFWQAIFESPAGYLAARAIARRLGLGTSPVLLAAYAVALAPLTDRGQVAVEVVASNRFRPGLADSVSTVAQTCPCVIDVAGAPFEDVIRQAWRSALGAYKHAYYDPAHKKALLPEVLFNDRRVRSRDDQAGAGAGGDSRLTWGERNDSPEEKVSLYLGDKPGTLCCELWADTGYVSPADMTALLWRFEAVLEKQRLEHNQERVGP